MSPWYPGHLPGRRAPPGTSLEVSPVICRECCRLPSVDRLEPPGTAWRASRAARNRRSVGMCPSWTRRRSDPALGDPGAAVRQLDGALGPRSGPGHKRPERDVRGRREFCQGSAGVLPPPSKQLIGENRPKCFNRVSKFMTRPINGKTNLYDTLF